MYSSTSTVVSTRSLLPVNMSRVAAEKTGVSRQVRVCQHCRGCEGCGSVGNHRLPSIAHSTKPTPLTTLNEDDIETTLCMATCLLTVRAANFLSLMSRKHAWNRCLMEWKWLHCNHSPRPPNREPGSMRKKEKKSRGHEDDGTPTPVSQTPAAQNNIGLSSPSRGNRQDGRPQRVSLQAFSRTSWSNPTFLMA